MPQAPHVDSPGDVTDVFVAGLLFFDLVFTGLDGGGPAPGTEIWTQGMASAPGGIANFATALRRLGLSTSLSAAFGNDVHGRYCWRVLAGAGVDLSRSRRFESWSQPVTVSLAYAGDRALVTHGAEPPVTPDELAGNPPPSRASIVHLGPEPARWLAPARDAGSLIFADVGWDPSHRWSPALLDQLALCHAFLPNAHEAMSYTRTDTPRAALAALADMVPLAVVTCGGDGALAIDATTGETASVPGLGVDVVDPTGAGDVFGAGLVAATLAAGLTLAQRLRFANLAAALSVQGIGGGVAAPGWAEIARWWRAVDANHGDSGLRHDYGFLADLIPHV